MKMEAEVGILQPQGMNPWEPPEARGHEDGLSPRVSGGSVALTTP